MNIFSSPITQARKLDQSQYLSGIVKYQKEIQDKISVVLVNRPSDPHSKAYSYKVSREAGLLLEEQVRRERIPLVVIQDKGHLVVCPVVKVVVEPDNSILCYPMRWVFQVLTTPQFLVQHRAELALVNKLG